jgi:hypothetical protein
MGEVPETANPTVRTLAQAGLVGGLVGGLTLLALRVLLGRHPGVAPGS